MDRSALRDEARRRFRPLFAALAELLAFIEATPIRRLRALPQTKEALALALHLSRAHSTAVGVIVLCEAMLGELAMMSGRVMVESVLSAHWMSLRVAERADRFERFSGVELVDFADLPVEQGHLERSDIGL